MVGNSQLEITGGSDPGACSIPEHLLLNTSSHVPVCGLECLAQHAQFCAPVSSAGSSHRVIILAPRFIVVQLNRNYVRGLWWCALLCIHTRPPLASPDATKIEATAPSVWPRLGTHRRQEERLFPEFRRQQLGQVSAFCRRKLLTQVVRYTL